MMFLGIVEIQEGITSDSTKIDDILNRFQIMKTIITPNNYWINTFFQNYNDLGAKWTPFLQLVKKHGVIEITEDQRKRLSTMKQFDMSRDNAKLSKTRTTKSNNLQSQLAHN